MPVKAKDKLIEEKKLVETTKKKTTSTKSKNTTKKDSTKSSSGKNSTKTKNTSKKTTKTNSTTKKSTTKVTKKTTKTNSTKSQKQNIIEYYDLPANYNKTIAKILAQTPTILFVYWDISDENRKSLINTYGEDFFNKTSPFLTITNITKNYSFDVEINDYANSWYIHIPDSDCKYSVSLIRKSKNNQINLENGYVSITSSNNLDAPNDHILFERLGKTVFFKDVKSNRIEEKDISSFYFMRNIGRIYNIYDLYKEIYKDELGENKLGLAFSSSQFK